MLKVQGRPGRVRARLSVPNSVLYTRKNTHEYVFQHQHECKYQNTKYEIQKHNTNLVCLVLE